MFALAASELGVAHAWVGILCYSLQIYFDFSGYSDMAIGLGRLLGFHFPENFDQPYRSRQCHRVLAALAHDACRAGSATTSTSRSAAIAAAALRTFANLWIVFFLCGLWHGAGLTFVVWGLYHGLLLVLERLADTQLRWRPSGWPGIAMTFSW